MASGPVTPEDILVEQATAIAEVIRASFLTMQESVGRLVSALQLVRHERDALAKLLTEERAKVAAFQAAQDLFGRIK